MTNPDRTVHCTEAFLATVCCVLLLVVLGACAAMIVDAYGGPQ